MPLTLFFEEQCYPFTTKQALETEEVLNALYSGKKSSKKKQLGDFLYAYYEGADVTNKDFSFATKDVLNIKRVEPDKALIMQISQEQINMLKFISSIDLTNMDNLKLSNDARNSLNELNEIRTEKCASCVNIVQEHS
jgi:hypothetical protein